MKLTEKLSQRDGQTPFFTFEFFPPRTDQGFTNLLARISRLTPLNPLAISVTWGAGGSTRERSMDLAGMSQARFGVDTIMHLTCTNMEQGMVEDALREAKDREITNLLALRGDPPRGSEFWLPIDPGFTHAIDLVKYIKSSPEFADYFCVGVAGYPDGHPDGQPLDQQMQHLKAKVDAGADYIITQLFYDVDNFKDWVRRVREAGITVPIIPGVMPIQNHTSFLRMAKLCGAKIPPEITAALEPIRNDDQKVKDYGVELATTIVKSITEDTSLGIRGVHFCTLNLEKSVRRILDALGWTHESHRPRNQIIDSAPAEPHLPSQVAISPEHASKVAVTALSNPPASLSVPQSSGQEDGSTTTDIAGVSSTWDEFPNGRFGDPSSPAYGVGSGDQWDPGAGGLGVSRAEAISQWGTPISIEDLNAIFTRHLNSDPRTPTTPFSPDPLLAESRMILPQLLDMTLKGWWTVGSQPAVDSAPSNDEIVGWGPAGGYVFQKSFVEFFCDEDSLRELEARVREENGWVTWYAANSQEEAFNIWSQWALLYPPNSETRVLLEKMRDTRWLVSIVHHNFKEPDALWKLLLDQ
ncbi:hypothetical protein FS837_008589 [Tulasnella sp. UAMH 9824]|nr:hypothetical protein FS837_008589 [Tulasnella sp. UAMH 9824]